MHSPLQRSNSSVHSSDLSVVRPDMKAMKATPALRIRSTSTIATSGSPQLYPSRSRNGSGRRPSTTRPGIGPPLVEVRIDKLIGWRPAESAPDGLISESPQEAADISSCFGCGQLDDELRAIGRGLARRAFGSFRFHSFDIDLHQAHAPCTHLPVALPREPGRSS
jgi:hypothetical protein